MYMYLAGWKRSERRLSFAGLEANKQTETQQFSSLPIIFELILVYRPLISPLLLKRVQVHCPNGRIPVRLYCASVQCDVQCTSIMIQCADEAAHAAGSQCEWGAGVSVPHCHGTWDERPHGLRRCVACVVVPTRTVRARNVPSVVCED